MFTYTWRIAYYLPHVFTIWIKSQNFMLNVHLSFTVVFLSFTLSLFLISFVSFNNSLLKVCTYFVFLICDRNFPSRINFVKCITEHNYIALTRKRYTCPSRLVSVKFFIFFLFTNRTAQIYKWQFYILIHATFSGPKKLPLKIGFRFVLVTFWRVISVALFHFNTCYQEETKVFQHTRLRGVAL
jgi:hypothetical protein